MANWKRYIPAPAKRFVKQFLQRSSDVCSGKKFANTFTSEKYPFDTVSLQQPVNITDTSSNKIHNLSIALEKMNGIIIAPGQTFSFWKLIGNPSEKNGYKKSRSIINGELEATVGGGLCQLSGLIYFLALQSGLRITERHAHSIDIYKDEERFTPLGSDATVAYGYKDLRFINNCNTKILIHLALDNNTLYGSILSEEEIVISPIEFIYTKHASYTDVTTVANKDGIQTALAQNRYKLLYTSA